MAQLALEPDSFEARAISPLLELGAYEALWENRETSFKTLSEKFSAQPGALPSDFVPGQKARENAAFVRRHFEKADIGHFGVRVHGAGDTRKNSGMPPFRSSCCIIKGGGTWWTPVLSLWLEHESRRRMGLLAPDGSCAN